MSSQCYLGTVSISDCSSPLADPSIQGCRAACRAMPEMHNRPDTPLLFSKLYMASHSIALRWLFCCYRRQPSFCTI